MSRSLKLGVVERPYTDAEFFEWWGRMSRDAAVGLVDRARACGQYGSGPNGEFRTHDEANDYILARCWSIQQPLYRSDEISVQPMGPISFFGGA